MKKRHVAIQRRARLAVVWLCFSAQPGLAVANRIGRIVLMLV